MQLSSTAGGPVYLHIGEPGTGGAGLRDLLWHHRDTLAAQGLVLPGRRPDDQRRAGEALRSGGRQWDVLAAQALRSRARAVISCDALGGADDEQVQRAVRSFAGRELHIVLTVAECGRVLAAGWQRAVVADGSPATWAQWLDGVLTADGAVGAASYRRLHSSADTLRMWQQWVPPGRTHVVIAPSRGDAGPLLWRRFAGVLGVDADRVADPGQAPESWPVAAPRPLGVLEVELLRRLNSLLDARAAPGEPADGRAADTRAADVRAADVRAADVRAAVVRRLLGRAIEPTAPVLPARHTAWVRARNEALAEALRQIGSGSGVTVAGDVAELLEARTTRLLDPARLGDQQVLDLAVDLAAAAALDNYRARSSRAKSPR